MTNHKPRLLIFASGSEDGGGSGFQKLIEAMLAGVLQAEIVGVVSNHANGGVRKIAEYFDIGFLHFPKDYTAENYRQIVRATQANFVALSGWLKLVAGLNPATTINIHPGPLEFGGKGMHGHHVHEAVIAAFKRGEITQSAVCMHFVTEKYDEGPVFFRMPIHLDLADTPDSLYANKIKPVEHAYQPWVTNLVVTGQIRLGEDGIVLVPEWYKSQPFCPPTAIVAL